MGGFVRGFWWIAAVALLLLYSCAQAGVNSLPPAVNATLSTAPAVKEKPVEKEVVEISRVVLPPRYDRDPYTPGYQQTPAETLNSLILLGRQISFKTNYTITIKRGQSVFTSRRLWTAMPPSVRVDDFTLDERKTYIFQNNLMTECSWDGAFPKCQTVSDFDKSIFEGVFSEWEAFRSKYSVERGSERGVAGKTARCFKLTLPSEAETFKEVELCYSAAGAPLFLKAVGESVLTIEAKDFTVDVMPADFIPPTPPAAPSGATRKVKNINDFPLEPEETKDYVRFYRGRV